MERAGFTPSEARSELSKGLMDWLAFARQLLDKQIPGVSVVGPSAAYGQLYDECERWAEGWGSNPVDIIEMAAIARIETSCSHGVAVADLLSNERERALLAAAEETASRRLDTGNDPRPAARPPATGRQQEP